MFVNIGNDFYIPSEKIKYLISSEVSYGNSGVLHKIISNAKREFMFYKCFASKSECYIVTDDNTVLASNLKIENIYSRFKDSGVKWLTLIDTLAFVNISLISMVQSSNVTLTIGGKRALNINDAELSFCRQREKRISKLIMRTGEIVHLSRNSEDVVDDINKAICL